MIFQNFNETDVREEFAVPLLSSLGYKTNSANDILREKVLKYPYHFLGRKKIGRDPALHGRADYIIDVRGFGKWVLEIKAPSEKVGIEEAQQAISYARHPEVSAHYAVLMNGIEFVIYDASQSAEEGELLRLQTCDVEQVRERVWGILSPDAIRRDFRPRTLDLGVSLGGSLKSHENIRSGVIEYSSADWDILQCPAGLHDQILADLRSRPDTITGMRAAVTGGFVKRADNGLILAQLKWHSPYRELASFAEAKKLDQVNYVCAGEYISSDSETPSVFDFVANFTMEKGEELFDPAYFKIT